MGYTTYISCVCLYCNVNKKKKFVKDYDGPTFRNGAHVGVCSRED